MVGGDSHTTLRALHRRARAALAEHCPDTAAFEAAQLTEKATGRPAGDLLLHGEEAPPPGAAEALEALLRRRLCGEPLQYLLGRWEFYGHSLRVGPGVLIPRPDTETVAEAAIGLLAGRQEARVADLCSGSGAIAIALWHALHNPHITAVELSGQALPYLRENVAHHCGGSHREAIQVLRGDVLLPHTLAEGSFDLIVSNPPYIPPWEMAGLSPEVRHEPEMALVGGEDGLLFYRAIAENSLLWLRPGGWLVFEVGYNQADQVAGLMTAAGYRDIAFAQDLSGIRRCVYGRGGRDSGESPK